MQIGLKRKSGSFFYSMNRAGEASVKPGYGWMFGVNLTFTQMRPDAKWANTAEQAR